tara:strand:- start:1353 stop:1646 length:294 start_codon:yes stop_codon:yes gene_type:complete
LELKVMQGINEKDASQYLSRNEQIHNLYLQGKTMEQIGEIYDISKQRVWQIIRRCKLGDGNYYEAVSIDSKQKKLPEEKYDAWLKDKGIKTIRKKVN